MLRRNQVEMAEEILKERGWVLFGNNTWRGRVSKLSIVECVEGGAEMPSCDFVVEGGRRVGLKVVDFHKK